MPESIVAESGRLRENFLPAIYLDSSVVIDYWMTEGLEMDEAEEGAELFDTPIHTTVREILKVNKRFATMVEIRKKLIFEDWKTVPVTTALAILELIEWHAEAVFKQVAAEASGAIFVQKQGKKQVGEYLRKVLNLRTSEEEGRLRDKGQMTGLEMLVSETMVVPSFVMSHGLNGLLLADIINFTLPVDAAWRLPSICAYLQLGAADVMHLLLAHHLGCQYFATFDSDFLRVKDCAKDELGISVINDPDELLSIL